MSTEKDWKKWGELDPYFGVLSDPKFRKSNLNKPHLEEFFQSGENHIEWIKKQIKDNFGEEIDNKKVLDYGCGVGRLLIPIAQQAREATGVDISEKMIQEAEKNIHEKKIKNTAFIQASEKSTNIHKKYDLIHSYIVFQHIPWNKGRRIIHELTSSLSPGGIIALHIFVTASAHPLTRFLVHTRYKIPPLNWLRNLFKGQKIFEPAMQIHTYNTNILIKDFSDLGIKKIAIIDDIDANMDGFHGVYLMGKMKVEN